MEQEFFNPYEEVAIHERNLPHWQQAGVLVFLTWRVADALPNSLLSNWRQELEVWRNGHPEPWDESTRSEYRRHFPARLEACLDAGHGSCPLRDLQCREPLEEALRHFDGSRYDLRACVVMPTHVHLVVRPFPEARLETIVQAWKSWSARAINRWRGSAGRVWQVGYWDRLVRDGKHLNRCLQYISCNPTKAGLRPKEFTLWMK